MVMLPEYQLGWPAGEKSLLLVSVGTGLCESEDLNLKTHQMAALQRASVAGCADAQRDERAGSLVPRVWQAAPLVQHAEVGFRNRRSRRNDSPIKEKLFTYLRYNAELSEGGLMRLGLFDAAKTRSSIDPKALQPLDGTSYIDELRTVGAAAAACITLDDFDGFLTARDHGASVVP